MEEIINKMIKALKKLVIYSLQWILYIISFFVPKSKNIWIFGAWGGETFSDNSKSVYEYVSKYTNRKAYWVCKDLEIVKGLLAKGQRAYYYYSLKGILIAMRASVVFITQTHADVNFYCCARAKVINCWHGIMMKKVLYDTENMKKSDRLSVRFAYNFLPFSNVISSRDYVVSTGELYNEITKTAFGVDEKHVYTNGYPRNDCFFSKMDCPDELKVYKEKGKKLLIYLPTHRSFGQKCMWDPMENLEVLDSMLEKHNMIMFFKPHFHEMYKMQNKINMYDNIKIITSYEYCYEINHYLPFFDLLVTDYSGAYFDFLLLDKPVVFFNYDLQWYIENDYGLYFEYEDIAKGPKCTSWTEVVSASKEILENDVWMNERTLIKKKVFKYIDGESSRRAYEFASGLIK